MGWLSILAVGFWLGMRHATDADHVVAVTTIVMRQRDVQRAALTGMAWGIGHTLTILVVGAIIIGFNVAIPPRVGLGMEVLVGAMLIALGLSTRAADFKAIVQRALSSRDRMVSLDMHAHSHGNYVHTHTHAHDREQHPHPPDQTPLSRLDRWFGRQPVYRWLRPLVVGVVHGLAGSAAVTLIVLAVIKDTWWAAGYLLIFGLGTVAGMMLVTVGLASTLQYAAHWHASFVWRLTTASCVVSVLLGAFILYRVVFVDGLLAVNPHWTP